MFVFEFAVDGKTTVNYFVEIGGLADMFVDCF